MFNPSPYFERPVEGTLGQFKLAVGEEGFTSDLGRVGFSPRVATIWTGRKIERLSGCLDCLRRIRPSQVDASEDRFLDYLLERTGS